MAVVTVSRQYGSGGIEIAVQACERLGYSYFDKALMAQVATEVGLSEQEIVDFSEDEHSVRGFLDRFLTGGPRESGARARLWTEAVDGIRAVEMIEMDSVHRITLVQGIIRVAYRRGNVVIVGRGGQAILKDMPGVLHVRIVAPMEERVRRIQDLEHLSRDTTRSLIAKKDAAAADYLKRFYQMDGTDCEHYHLVINTGRWSTESAAQLIVLAVGCLPSVGLFLRTDHSDTPRWGERQSSATPLEDSIIRA